MRNLYLLISLCILTSFAFGQSQRITLVEQVTSASCGPCAGQNPAFNALLNPNEPQLAIIKYQRGGGSYLDDMFDHNPGDVNNRIVTYYGVTSFPQVWVNGSLVGSPSAVTQASLDAENAIPADLEIDVEGILVANDDVYVGKGEVRFGQDFTNSTMALHVVVVERDITYDVSNPPGLNGELNFEWVMRDMLTPSQGLNLGTRTSGEVYQYTYSTLIDHNVIDKTELRVVAFVQNMDNGEVLNASASWVPKVTSIEDLELASYMQIVPSIADQSAQLHFTLSEATEAQVNIFSSNGQLVQTIDQEFYSAGENQIDLNVSDLSGGLYNVVITSETAISSEKLIVQ